MTIRLPLPRMCRPSCAPRAANAAFRLTRSSVLIILFPQWCYGDQTYRSICSYIVGCKHHKGELHLVRHPDLGLRGVRAVPAARADHRGGPVRLPGPQACDDRLGLLEAASVWLFA